MTKTNRKEYIDEVLYKFRNGMAREFYYEMKNFHLYHIFIMKNRLFTSRLCVNTIPI